MISLVINLLFFALPAAAIALAIKNATPRISDPPMPVTGPLVPDLPPATDRIRDLESRHKMDQASPADWWAEATLPLPPPSLHKPKPNAPRDARLLNQKAFEFAATLVATVDGADPTARFQDWVQTARSLVAERKCILAQYTEGRWDDDTPAYHHLDRSQHWQALEALAAEVALVSRDRAAQQLDSWRARLEPIVARLTELAVAKAVERAAETPAAATTRFGGSLTSLNAAYRPLAEWWMQHQPPRVPSRAGRCHPSRQSAVVAADIVMWTTGADSLDAAARSNRAAAAVLGRCGKIAVGADVAVKDEYGFMPRVRRHPDPGPMPDGVDELVREYVAWHRCDYPCQITLAHLREAVSHLRLHCDRGPLAEVAYHLERAVAEAARERRPG